MKITHTHYYGCKQENGDIYHCSREVVGDHETNRNYRILAQSGVVALELPVPIEQIRSLFVGTRDALAPNLSTAWDIDSGLPFPFPDGFVRVENAGLEDAGVAIKILHDEPVAGGVAEAAADSDLPHEIEHAARMRRSRRPKAPDSLEVMAA